MQSGLLYTPITIEQPDPSEHEYGGDSRSWVKLYDTRAFERHAGGQLGVSQSEIFATDTAVFEIHLYHRDKINRYMRIRRGDDLYRIEDIEVNKRSKKVIITCTLINE